MRDYQVYAIGVDTWITMIETMTYGFKVMAH